MLLRRTTVLLPLLATVQAFKNAAPFLMLSTDWLPDVLKDTQIQTAETVDNTIASFQNDLVSRGGAVRMIYQPELSIEDFEHLPRFAAIANSPKLSQRLTIPNVVGEQDMSVILPRLGQRSDYWRMTSDKTFEEDLSWARKSSFLYFSRDKLSEEDSRRQTDLEVLDDQLARLLDELPATSTLMVMSSPRGDFRSPQRYSMDEPAGLLHQDLKRDTELHTRASNSSKKPNDNFQDGLPLFERYAYFSPALFMGMSVSILLLVILWVGVSAIAGLEVSYMAFSKDMAPQSQKKQE